MSEFYNTIGLEGDELKEATGVVADQDTKVKQIFTFHGNGAGLTPREVHAHGGGYAEWELTSVRRSINSLTKSGFLIKTQQKRWGDKGQKQHVWKRKPVDNQMRLL